MKAPPILASNLRMVRALHALPDGRSKRACADTRLKEFPAETMSPSAAGTVPGEK